MADRRPKRKHVDDGDSDDERICPCFFGGFKRPKWLRRRRAEVVGPEGASAGGVNAGGANALNGAARNGETVENVRQTWENRDIPLFVADEEEFEVADEALQIFRRKRLFGEVDSDDEVEIDEPVKRVRFQRIRDTITSGELGSNLGAGSLGDWEAILRERQNEILRREAELNRREKYLRAVPPVSVGTTPVSRRKRPASFLYGNGRSSPESSDYEPEPDPRARPKSKTGLGKIPTFDKPATQLPGFDETAPKKFTKAPSKFSKNEREAKRRAQNRQAPNKKARTGVVNRYTPNDNTPIEIQLRNKVREVEAELERTSREEEARERAKAKQRDLQAKKDRDTQAQEDEERRRDEKRKKKEQDRNDTPKVTPAVSREQAATPKITSDPFTPLNTSASVLQRHVDPALLHASTHGATSLLEGLANQRYKGSHPRGGGSKEGTEIGPPNNSRSSTHQFETDPPALTGEHPTKSNKPHIPSRPEYSPDATAGESAPVKPHVTKTRVRKGEDTWNPIPKSTMNPGDRFDPNEKRPTRPAFSTSNRPSHPHEHVDGRIPMGTPIFGDKDTISTRNQQLEEQNEALGKNSESTSTPGPETETLPGNMEYPHLPIDVDDSRRIDEEPETSFSTGSATSEEDPHSIDGEETVDAHIVAKNDTDDEGNDVESTAQQTDPTVLQYPTMDPSLPDEAQARLEAIRLTEEQRQRFLALGVTEYGIQRIEWRLFNNEAIVDTQGHGYIDKDELINNDLNRLESGVGSVREVLESYIEDGFLHELTEVNEHKSLTSSGEQGASQESGVVKHKMDPDELKYQERMKKFEQEEQELLDRLLTATNEQVRSIQKALESLETKRSIVEQTWAKKKKFKEEQRRKEEAEAIEIINGNTPDSSGGESSQYSPSPEHSPTHSSHSGPDGEKVTDGDDDESEYDLETARQQLRQRLRNEFPDPARRTRFTRQLNMFARQLRDTENDDGYIDQFIQDIRNYIPGIDRKLQQSETSNDRDEDGEGADSLAWKVAMLSEGDPDRAVSPFDPENHWSYLDEELGSDDEGDPNEGLLGEDDDEVDEAGYGGEPNEKSPNSIRKRSPRSTDPESDGSGSPGPPPTGIGNRTKPVRPATPATSIQLGSHTVERLDPSEPWNPPTGPKPRPPIVTPKPRPPVSETGTGFGNRGSNLRVTRQPSTSVQGRWPQQTESGTMYVNPYDEARAEQEKQRELERRKKKTQKTNRNNQPTSAALPVVPTGPRPSLRVHPGDVYTTPVTLPAADYPSQSVMERELRDVGVDPLTGYHRLRKQYKRHFGVPGPNVQPQPDGASSPMTGIIHSDSGNGRDNHNANLDQYDGDPFGFNRPSLGPINGEDEVSKYRARRRGDMLKFLDRYGEGANYRSKSYEEIERSYKLYSGFSGKKIRKRVNDRDNHGRRDDRFGGTPSGNGYQGRSWREGYGTYSGEIRNIERGGYPFNSTSGGSQNGRQGCGHGRGGLGSSSGRKSSYTVQGNSFGGMPNFRGGHEGRGPRPTRPDSGQLDVDMGAADTAGRDPYARATSQNRRGGRTRGVRGSRLSGGNSRPRTPTQWSPRSNGSAERSGRGGGAGRGVRVGRGGVPTGPGRYTGMQRGSGNDDVDMDRPDKPGDRGQGGKGSKKGQVDKGGKSGRNGKNGKGSKKVVGKGSGQDDVNMDRPPSPENMDIDEIRSSERGRGVSMNFNSLYDVSDLASDNAPEEQSDSTLIHYLHYRQSIYEEHGVGFYISDDEDEGSFPPPPGQLSNSWSLDHYVGLDSADGVAYPELLDGPEIMDELPGLPDYVSSDPHTYNNLGAPNFHVEQDLSSRASSVALIEEPAFQDPFSASSRSSSNVTRLSRFPESYEEPISPGTILPRKTFPSSPPLFISQGYRERKASSSSDSDSDEEFAIPFPSSTPNKSASESSSRLAPPYRGRGTPKRHKRRSPSNEDFIPSSPNLPSSPEVLWVQTPTKHVRQSYGKAVASSDPLQGSARLKRHLKLHREEEEVLSSPPISSRTRSRFRNVSQEAQDELALGSGVEMPIRPVRWEQVDVGNLDQDFADSKDGDTDEFRESARPRRRSPVVLIPRRPSPVVVISRRAEPVVVIDLTETDEELVYIVVD